MVQLNFEELKKIPSEKITDPWEIINRDLTSKKIRKILNYFNNKKAFLIRFLASMKLFLFS